MHQMLPDEKRISMYKKVIDLSVEIYDGAPTMPMDPKCSVSEHCNLDNLGYNLTRLTISTHQGTHLDAPYHFFYDGTTVDKIDPARFIVRAIKIDLTHKKPKDPIDVADIAPYEKQISQGMSILFHTGWDKVFPKKEFFSDFPFVTLELARYIADKKIPLIGMDMPTPNGQAWKELHETLLRESVVIVEGLCSMEELGNEEFTLIALPLKIRGRDGSPVRAVALLD